jgi:uncharacterized metal-binding protein
MSSVMSAGVVHITNWRESFLIIKPTRRTNFSNLFWNETLRVSNSSSVHHQELSTVHSAMVYVIQVCRQLSSSRIRMILLLDSCLQICTTYTIAECTVDNSWRWTEELFETCRVSFQNKFEKLIILLLDSCLQTCMTHTIAECTVDNSWWWTEELFEEISASSWFYYKEICHDTRSHVTMHGHMSRCTITCHDARSHERKIRRETFLIFNMMYLETLSALHWSRNIYSYL